MGAGACGPECVFGCIAVAHGFAGFFLRFLGFKVSYVVAKRLCFMHAGLLENLNKKPIGFFHTSGSCSQGLEFLCRVLYGCPSKIPKRGLLVWLTL